MKAAQSKKGKMIFSNEKIARAVLKGLRKAGKENPESNYAVKIKFQSNNGKVFILKEG